MFPYPEVHEMERGGWAMKVSFFFAWFDLWIGAYYDQKKRIWYFCPLPCCVIKLELNRNNFRCPDCGKEYNEKWEIINPGDINVQHVYYSNDVRIAVRVKELGDE